MPRLSVATYNIHKGFSSFNRRVVIHELRERLAELNADIVFLQEVQGEHARHAARHVHYPDEPQHEFLAGERWPHRVYGMNAVYRAGHHGNAILSRFPILYARNQDISAHRFERRGLLHGVIHLAGQEVHCLCVHFGLFARGRRQQAHALIGYVQQAIPADAPLIVAGDFNDWRNQLGPLLAHALELQDVFHVQAGRPARSFPARLPLLCLDRIYVRGFHVIESEVHAGEAWRRLSDHAPLLARLKKK